MKLGVVHDQVTLHRRVAFQDTMLWCFLGVVIQRRSLCICSTPEGRRRVFRGVVYGLCTVGTPVHARPQSAETRSVDTVGPTSQVCMSSARSSHRWIAATGGARLPGAKRSTPSKWHVKMRPKWLRNQDAHGTSASRKSIASVAFREFLEVVNVVLAVSLTTACSPFRMRVECDCADPRERTSTRFRFRRIPLANRMRKGARRSARCITRLILGRFGH